MEKGPWLRAMLC